LTNKLNPEVLVQLDWQPAPSLTEWGPGMLRASISISEDETLELVLSEEGLALLCMERPASRLARPSGPWPFGPRREATIGRADTCGAATGDGVATVLLSSSAPAHQGPGGSKITPLRRLVEGQPYQPGADELVILPEHSLEDVLRHLVQEWGGERVELVAILETMEPPAAGAWSLQPVVP
jgi:hypothetical protein